MTLQISCYLFLSAVSYSTNFTSEMCRLHTVYTQESFLHVAFIHPRVSMGTSLMLLSVIYIWTGIPSRQRGGGGRVIPSELSFMKLTALAYVFVRLNTCN